MSECSKASCNNEPLNKQFDYLGLFRERLDTVPQIPEWMQKSEAYHYRHVGIQRLKRHMVAIALESFTDPERSELWIDELRDFMSVDSPHHELRLDYKRFINTGATEDKLEQSLLKGYILQDDDDNLVFLINERGAKELHGRDNEAVQAKYQKLLCRYGVSRVIGPRVDSRSHPNDNSITAELFENIIPYEWEDLEVLFTDEDLLGKRRQDLYWNVLAERNGLTNNQLLRTRILASCAFNAGQPFSTTEFAKNQTQEVN